jgi:hypothetical protein
MDPTTSRSSDSAVGMTMAVSAVLSVLLMMAHPTAHGPHMPAFAEEVRREALLNMAVHGSLIALLLVTAAGYSFVAGRIGSSTFLMRLAMTAYGAGVAGMVAAALISGMVVPEFLVRYEGRPPEDLELARHALGLARAVNQVCTRMAVVALSASAAMFGVALWKFGTQTRAVGILGILAGVLPVAALAGGYLPMNVHGVLAFVGAQTVWTLCLAWLLIQGRMQGRTENRVTIDP